MPRAAALVEGDAGRDRERPRAQVLGVRELGIRAQGAQERLLESVLRAVTAEQADEVAEDLVAVGFVEALERWNGHRLHHPV